MSSFISDLEDLRKRKNKEERERIKRRGRFLSTDEEDKKK